MPRKRAVPKQDNDNDSDMPQHDEGADGGIPNYIMGQIMVNDGTADETVSFLDEYADEVDDEAESQAKAARKKLMNEEDDDDALVGNPNDTDDFSKAEKYDADEDWPLD